MRYPWLEVERRKGPSIRQTSHFLWLYKRNRNVAYWSGTLLIRNCSDQILLPFLFRVQRLSGFFLFSSIIQLAGHNGDCSTKPSEIINGKLAWTLPVHVLEPAFLVFLLPTLWATESSLPFPLRMRLWTLDFQSSSSLWKTLFGLQRAVFWHLFISLHIYICRNCGYPFPARNRHAI